MEIIEQSAVFVKTKLKEHVSIKSSLLNSIRNTGIHSIVEVTQQISNSDWYLPQNFRRGYDNMFMPLVDSYSKELQDILKFPFRLGCSGYWFQQYAQGDFHNWHTHECTYASVYYLDLPEGSSKTSFKLIDKEFEIDVEEGDILTFPGSTLHCSKPNKSDKVKTVIAFNLSPISR
jgi:hypothetical protein